MIKIPIYRHTIVFEDGKLTHKQELEAIFSKVSEAQSYIDMMFVACESLGNVDFIERINSDEILDGFYRANDECFDMIYIGRPREVRE